MKIFIDADGCPVVDITAATAKKYNIECIIVCDSAHVFNRDGVKTITVEKGSDSVDFKLVNMICAGDIAVTQDYGLAAMCLARKAVPINQNGLVFDENNIESLLYSRHMSRKIRMSGGRTKGPSARSAQQDKDYENALNMLIKQKNNI